MSVIILVCSFLLSACGVEIGKNKLVEKYTNSASKFMLLEGHRIHYRDEGKGEVIVLLHGTASSLHTWDKWVQVLSKEYRVIRMDLPGFGLTGPDKADRYEVVDDINFLNKFLAQLNIKKMHLVGSSLGGRIAWEYSLLHAGQVESLSLMNALGYPQESWPPPIEMAQWPIMDEIMTHVSPRFMYKTGLKDVYFDKHQVTEKVVDRYFELSRFPGNLEAFPKRVKARLDQDSNKISQISVPTLIMWGREDKYFPVESAIKFHEDINDSTIYIYAGVGHLPMEEVPNQSVANFREFIDTHIN